MIYFQARPLNRTTTGARTVRALAPQHISQHPSRVLSGNRSLALLPDRAAGRSVHPWLGLVALGFGAVVAILDTSMVNVTLPTLQQSWHTDLSIVSWVLHLYNLLFAICLVPAGRLADLFGRKRLTLIGLLLFLVGSLLCGLSPSLLWLLGARAVQAVGGAFVSALVQIGHASQSLTPMDHLSLQRKAVDLLLSNGEQCIEAEDITWIQVVIEEATHLRETLGSAQGTTCPEGGLARVFTR